MDSPCYGHGQLEDGVCVCDRYYLPSSQCQRSFRDEYGAALPLAQTVLFMLYAPFLWVTVQQLLRVKCGWNVRVASMASITVASASRLLWLADPYGWGGMMSPSTSLLLNNVPYVALSLAISTTVTYWMQMLRSDSLRLQAVLNGVYLYSLVLFWTALAGISTVLLVAHARSDSSAFLDAYNAAMAVASLSQSAVLLSAANRLKRAVLLLTDRARSRRLVNLVNQWSLAGISGFLVTILLAAFVLFKFHEEPWVFFVVMFVLIRVCLLVVMLVLFSAHALGPTPLLVGAIMRAGAACLCLWVPPGNGQSPLWAGDAAETNFSGEALGLQTTNLATPNPATTTAKADASAPASHTQQQQQQQLQQQQPLAPWHPRIMPSAPAPA